jgi:hypothetical protein
VEPRMSGRTVGVLLAILMFGVLAYGLWYQRQYPREIVKTGTVVVQSHGAGGAPVSLKTRDVSINGVVFSEVELPNGTWIGCQGDCRKAVREAGSDFWETRARDTR